MCPFCYIGKRKFEAALAQFPQKDQMHITWKSFQLSPDLITQTDIRTDQYLAQHKGISLAEAQGMQNYVTQIAEKVGLRYDFDKAIVANSFKAHCFTHFAKQYDKQQEAEEQLFKAYFTDGKNIDDTPALLQIGAEIGLDTGALETALAASEFANDVRNDIYEAQQLGIRGVPFFLFNRKFAVSGAQESALFLQALEQSFADWQEAHKASIA